MEGYRSVQVQPATDTCSPVYRNGLAVEHLINTVSPHITNIQEMWTNSVKSFPDHNCLSTIDKKQNKLIHHSYKETNDVAHALASAIEHYKLQNSHLGIRMLGVCSKNRLEWMQTDIACLLLGLCNVSLYDTFRKEAFEHCIQKCNLASIFCSGPVAAQLAQSQCPSLRNLILFDEIDKQVCEKLAAKKINLLYFKSLLKQFEGKKVQLHKVEPSSVYTFCFTSGTTGNSKVAVMKHDGFIANMAAIFMNKSIILEEKDIHISYLPLAHCFQRMCMLAVLQVGGNAVFFSGDVTKLTEDMNICKPTFWITVPRLLNRIYQGIISNINKSPPQLKQKLEQAVQAKINLIKAKACYQDPTIDPYFKSMRQIIGGNVKQVITGAAPVAASVLDFLKAVWSMPIIEGYGQTESYAATFLTVRDDPEAGHVGFITTASQFKLQSVPEMNYFNHDKNEKGESTPRGQILVRGAIIQEYFDDPEKTKQAIDGDGWLHTGDVGMVLPNKTLKIIDRKKNIFKLQQGQYVAPQKIQNIFAKFSGVNQVFVHGDSMQTFLVCVITPDVKLIQALKKQTGKQELNHKSIRSLLIKQMDQFGRKQQLLGFELPKNVYLQSEGFGVKGIMTGTMKLQRFKAKQVFESEIADMYKQGMI